MSTPERRPGTPSTGRPAPGRSAAEIRRDIDIQRQQLGTSVHALRGKVNELTDWKRQAREHKRELMIAAGAVGVLVGLRLLRGRRNR